MRVVVKRVRAAEYVQVVYDHKRDGKWLQVVLVSYGRKTPEAEARAVVALVLLERLVAELRVAPCDAFEAEVVRVLGPAPVQQLRQAMQPKPT